MDIKEEALRLHKEKKGKIEIKPKNKKIRNNENFKKFVKKT